MRPEISFLGKLCRRRDLAKTLSWVALPPGSRGSPTCSATCRLQVSPLPCPSQVPVGPARMGESLRTQEPVSHFHTTAQLEFHHSWTFFLWASIGSTQRMGHRSPLPDPTDLSGRAASSGLFREGRGCSTRDPCTTILSAFPPTILVCLFFFFLLPAFGIFSVPETRWQLLLSTS